MPRIQPRKARLRTCASTPNLLREAVGHFGGAAAGAGSGIGKMLAIRQPAEVFTMVWFIRNDVSGAGWPGGPMLKVIGT